MKVNSTNSFINDVEKLQPQDRDDIIDALAELETLKSLSESTKLRKLQGQDKVFRLKVKKYRVLLSWDKSNQILLVESVKHRKDIYKNR
jgi:mRNA-degrading endonuclease RelE of RelBE toxin-antitoxin system